MLLRKAHCVVSVVLMLHPFKGQRRLSQTLSRCEVGGQSIIIIIIIIAMTMFMVLSS